MKNREYRIIDLFYACILIFLLWQTIAIIINSPILPTPLKIVQYIYTSFTKDILIHALYSLYRILAGVILTLIVGVPLGLIMGYYDKIDVILSPILYLNYPVPKTALLPIIMLFFGVGEWSKIIMIFLITFFPLIVNVRDKVKNIPDEIYHTMYSVGASNGQIIREIVIKGIYSSILTSLRISIGIAISVLFIAENFGTEYGMGYLIMDSWMRINYVQMYSAILILSFIGLLLFIIVDFLEKALCPWNN